ncbi:hypothetical protein BDP81DRAFT_506163 [Colletotrichum phormii]|uniref:Uncharacterized protein n=1 Tax=Colletotrichum phormii TaxID=359342 RepID=A0AAJ0EAM5_9PEZI|nr:uncharacterized protein BDP81DRAFT_506163 [Colletotrichum phormii]KAK1622832.1 hypothetical protein BDP81DRAFT_506163 [Colletotrichum phormii]
MAGAFANFGPSQYSELYPAITKPNAGGQLCSSAKPLLHITLGLLDALSTSCLLHCVGSINDTEAESPCDAHGWAMDFLEFGCIQQQASKGGKSSAQAVPSPLPFFPLPGEMPTDRRKFNHLRFNSTGFIKVEDEGVSEGGFGSAKQALKAAEPAIVPERFQSAKIVKDAQSIATNYSCAAAGGI